jgi:hypothetical protein
MESADKHYNKVYEKLKKIVIKEIDRRYLQEFRQDYDFGNITSFTVDLTELLDLNNELIGDIIWDIIDEYLGSLNGNKTYWDFDVGSDNVYEISLCMNNNNNKVSS